MRLTDGVFKGNEFDGLRIVNERGEERVDGRRGTGVVDGRFAAFAAFAASRRFTFLSTNCPTMFTRLVLISLHLVLVQ